MEKFPVIVFWDKTINEIDLKLIKESLYFLLDFLGLEKKELHFLGNHEFLRSTEEKHSIEDLITNAWDSQRNQVTWENFYISLINILPSHIRKIRRVVFTHRDLFAEEYNYLVGCADGITALISFYRFNSVCNQELLQEIIKTEIFHEVGHIFGLPTERRGTANIDYSIGLHCKNNGCSMKQGLHVPDDWCINTKIRLANGGDPYCHDCMEDLRQLSL